MKNCRTSGKIDDEKRASGGAGEGNRTLACSLGSSLAVNLIKWTSVKPSVYGTNYINR
jgi:hypothetical protein